jgi:hypothetical protein
VGGNGADVCVGGGGGAVTGGGGGAGSLGAGGIGPVVVACGGRVIACCVGWGAARLPVSRARIGGGASITVADDAGETTVASGSKAVLCSPKSRVVGFATASRTFDESNCTVLSRSFSIMNSSPPSCVQNFWVSVE